MTRFAEWGRLSLTGGALALGGMSFVNHRRARRAESEHPPLGHFMTVDGVALHYLERGSGRPLVLLHGNGTMIEDWLVSGLVDELAKTHRLIAFDRPGFGHSSRPHDRMWTVAAQAEVIARGLRRLGVERPIIVGHSLGTLVALTLALKPDADLSGLALLGGYFYPSARADVLMVAPSATPGLGTVLRHTISPLVGRAMESRINARIFGPAPVPVRWRRDFPMSLAMTPGRIRAGASDATQMVPTAAALAPLYGELQVPTVIVAGRDDRMVDTAAQSARLHEALPGSRLVTVAGAGHMVHHSATQKVAEAIRTL